MNAHCHAFRAALERSLDGGPKVERPADRGPQVERPLDREIGARIARELDELSWHEHLLSCAECRALLESEEALEVLIATLPRPKLPRRLAQRVLVRLRVAREDERSLDELLALDAGERAPTTLAPRVLAGLAAARAEEHAAANASGTEAALDRLLARAEHVDVPAGLAQRVRLRLAAERNAPVRAPASTRWRRRALALAAGVIVAAGAWWFVARALQERGPQTPDFVEQGSGSNDAGAPATHLRPPSVAGGVSSAAPGDELLAVIDVLEQWDVLMHDDVDVLLSTTLSTADESLLEDGNGDPLAPANDDGAAKPDNALPSKGSTSPPGSNGAKKPDGKKG